MRLLPQETQLKSFKIVESSKGEINFRAPPRYLCVGFDPADGMFG